MKQKKKAGRSGAFDFEIAFKKSEGRCFVGDDAKYLCVISA